MASFENKKENSSKRWLADSEFPNPESGLDCCYTRTRTNSLGEDVKEFCNDFLHAMGAEFCLEHDNLDRSLHISKVEYYAQNQENMGCCFIIDKNSDVVCNAKIYDKEKRMCIPHSEEVLYSRK